MTEIRDIDVEMRDKTGDIASVSWKDAAGLRYHYWTHLPSLDPASYKPERPTLYKNAPHGTERSDPGHFWARKLDANSRPSRQMIEDAIAVISERALVEKAYADRTARIAAEEAQLDADIAAKAEKEAWDTQGRAVAGDLLDAVRGALNAMNAVTSAWENGDLAGAVRDLPVAQLVRVIAQAKAAGIKGA